MSNSPSPKLWQNMHSPNPAARRRSGGVSGGGGGGGGGLAGRPSPSGRNGRRCRSVRPRSPHTDIPRAPADAVRAIHSSADGLDGPCAEGCLLRLHEAGVAEQLEELPLEGADRLQRAHAQKVVAAELELGLAADGVPLVVGA